MIHYGNKKDNSMGCNDAEIHFKTLIMKTFALVIPSILQQNTFYSSEDRNGFCTTFTDKCQNSSSKRESKLFNSSFVIGNIAGSIVPLFIYEQHCSPNSLGIIGN
jgi:hypothetical protein